MIGSAAAVDWSGGDRMGPLKTVRPTRSSPSAVVRSDLTTQESKAEFADRAAMAGDATAIAVLVTFLEDGDNEVIAAAADALGHIGLPARDPDACLRLAQLLGDEAKPRWLRDTCAYALGEIGCDEPDVIQALSQAAECDGGSIGRCAREAIDKLTGPGSSGG